MKQAKSIKAVIFDLPTIIRFGKVSQVKTLHNVFEKQEIEISEEEVKPSFGVTIKEHISNLLRQENVRDQYNKRFHRQIDELFIKNFWNKYIFELEEDLVINSEPLIEAENLFRLLKSEGIKTATTTDFSQQFTERFLNKYFKSRKNFPDISLSYNNAKFGRPYPYVINEISEILEIPDSDSIVKLGSNFLDLEEAKNAKVWGGAVIENYFNQINEEHKLSSGENLTHKFKKVENSFIFKEADLILSKLADVPEHINRLNRRLDQGEFPGGRMKYPNQKYLLYTPGPLTTSKRVKLPMLVDHGSRETEYMETVQEIRKELVKLALNDTNRDFKNRKVNEDLEKKYTTVIVQGSGTFGVEATIASVIPKTGKLLVIINGAYGKRMQQMAKIHNINYVVLTYDENEVPNVLDIDSMLTKDKDITHVGVIHSETTTGILNPIDVIAKVVKNHSKILIVDAMSSFGAIPIDVNTLGIDYLVSSSNKNIQGVPGFSYVIARTEDLAKAKDATTYTRKTLSLDLYDQWDYLEKSKGGFRFTSPVHTLMSFKEAIYELIEEGGVNSRFDRYKKLQSTLDRGMTEMNFKAFDLKGHQGPIITTFHSPKCPKYDFNRFYEELKKRGCVIYPGKLTKEDSFRIGTIGYLQPSDIDNLHMHIKECMFWDNKI